MNMIARLTAAAIVAGGCAGAAFAQHDMPPGSAAAPGMMMGMGHGEMMGMGPMMGGPGEHVAGRLAFLKAELAITPEQEAAWSAYAAALEASSASMREMRDRMMAPKAMPATFPERLATRDAMMTARLDDMKRLTAAAGPLYVSLSPDQKEVADKLLGGM